MDLKPGSHTRCYRPVIASQVHAFLFLGFTLKSSEPAKDEFASVKHQRWLYIWALQFHYDLVLIDVVEMQVGSVAEWFGGSFLRRP